MAEIELTDADRANGWTEESLAAYIAEREKAQSGVIFFDPDFREQALPTVQNYRYNPFRWR